MGSSFVGIGGRGFWMRDWMLEIALRFLALHIEDPPEPAGSTATRVRDQWLLASRGFFNGCVPHDFEGAVSTEEGARLVRNAIESLLEELTHAPRTLSKDVLNLMGFESPFEKDLGTWRLVEVGRALLDLMDGKITSGPEDTSFMPGCRDSPSWPI
jgi:hypothetical protein